MLIPTPHARRSRWRPSRPVALVVTGAAAVLLVAACSSGSSSGSAGGKLSAADQAGLAKARADVAKLEKRPTQITVTTKIGEPIPKGKTIDFITCGATPECTQEGNIVKQADSVLGWKTVILNNDGTPQTQKAAFNQVVRTKPAAVLYSAIPAATFASEVPAMKKNGTFIAATSITDAVGSATGIGYAIGVPAQVPPIAGAQAAVVAAGVKDAGPSLIVNIPDFEILNISVRDYKAAMKTYCPTCQVSQLNVALSNVGQAASTTVSYLRSHPSIKWVVAATDALTVGLPAALKAAGLSDVKIVGQGATPTNLQYLHSGDQAADVAFPYYEELYAMVNAVAQHEAGAPVTPSTDAPLWVLTPNNAPPTSSQAFPVVPGYQAQYKALWGQG